MPAGPLVSPPVTTGGAPLTSDVLSSLQGFTWDGLGFPCHQTSLELRQDLTIHKFADRDGAHVESCGRHPVEITARLPFFNGLLAGKQETWSANTLYPDTWRLFLLKALNRTSKVLVHPELGPLTVKLQQCRTDWSADTRNGVWVDVKWIETDDTGDQLTNSLANVSAYAAALDAASDLDTNCSDPTIPDNYYVHQILPPGVSFIGAINEINALLATAQFAESQIQSYVSNIISTAAGVVNTVVNIGESLTPQALLWPIVQSAEQIKDAAYTFEAISLNRQPSVSFYAPTSDMTLAKVSNIVHADIGDLIQLNPSLASLTFVPAGVPVSYYTPTG